MNIKLNLKFEKNTMLVLIPFLLVIGLFVFNCVMSFSAEKIKFKVMAYDPYDVLMGNYINLTFDQDSVCLPELDEYICIDDLSNEDEIFYKFYKEYFNLTEDEKNKLDNIFENMKKDAKQLDDVNESFKLYYEKITFLNSKLIYSEKYENYYIKQIFAKRMFEFAKALSNSNMKFSDYINRVNLIELNEKEFYENKYCNNCMTYYIYYEVNKEGYAQISKISLNKDKTLDNKKCLTYDFYPICSSSLFNVYSLRDNDNKFYMDERIVSDADKVILDALDEGKDICAICKLFNNNIQIEDIEIDNVSINDYIKKY